MLIIFRSLFKRNISVAALKKLSSWSTLLICSLRFCSLGVSMISFFVRANEGNNVSKIYSKSLFFAAFSPVTASNKASISKSNFGVICFVLCATIASVKSFNIWLSASDKCASSDTVTPSCLHNAASLDIPPYILRSCACVNTISKISIWFCIKLGYKCSVKMFCLSN